MRDGQAACPDPAAGHPPWGTRTALSEPLPYGQRPPSPQEAAHLRDRHPSCQHTGRRQQWARPLGLAAPCSHGLRPPVRCRPVCLSCVCLSEVTAICYVIAARPPAYKGDELRPPPGGPPTPQGDSWTADGAQSAPGPLPSGPRQAVRTHDAY